MRLNWLRNFERLDKRTLQEIWKDPENNLIHRGGVVVLCEGCKRWVSKHDYQDYCKLGFHEFSNEVSVGTEVQAEASSDFGQVISN